MPEKTCPNCRNEIPMEAEICPYCNLPVHRKISINISNISTGNKIMGLLILALIGAVIITSLLIGGLVYITIGGFLLLGAIITYIVRSIKDKRY